MGPQGEGPPYVGVPSLACCLAPRADRLALLLSPQSQRLLEQGPGCRLRLAAPALRVHWTPGPEQMRTEVREVINSVLLGRKKWA